MAVKKKITKKIAEGTPTNRKGDSRGMNPTSRSNLKMFQPGQSGNPKGYPKGKRNASTLARLAFDKLSLAVLEKVNKDRSAKKLTLLTLEESGVDAELDMWVAQCEKARKGDTRAFEIVNAYLHGKPTQNLNVGGQADNPVEHKHKLAEEKEEINKWLDGWFNPPEVKKDIKNKEDADNKTK